MKRKIISMALISILLMLSFAALPACDDDDDLDANSVARAYCSKYQECDPQEFAEDYTSLDECTNMSIAYYIMYVNQRGQACGDAYLVYGDCVSRQPCNAPDSACAAEFQAAEALCNTASSPCPGYVSGTDDDYCCQTTDPCGWASDDTCDCGGACSWDLSDCAE